MQLTSIQPVLYFARYRCVNVLVVDIGMRTYIGLEN